MACPNFINARRALCGAVDCLFHPSVLEQKLFCKGKYYQKCGIYLFFNKTEQKVSHEQYVEEIQEMHFEEGLIYS